MCDTNQCLDHRPPELQVVLLSMLSHSTLTSIPDDFICDDRKSLVRYLYIKCVQILHNYYLRQLHHHDLYDYDIYDYQAFQYSCHEIFDTTMVF